MTDVISIVRMLAVAEHCEQQGDAERAEGAEGRRECPDGIHDSVAQAADIKGELPREVWDILRQFPLFQLLAD